MTTLAKLISPRREELSLNPRQLVAAEVLYLVSRSKEPGFPLAAFRHDEHWYYRCFDATKLQRAMSNNLVEVAGTYGELKTQGIIGLYLSKHHKTTNSKSIFYRVKDSKLNKLISEGLN